jgi:sugar lactone lactonase YvrE
MARANSLCTPLDAVLSPDGTQIYYTALDATGSGAVFNVACGGGTPSTLASGLLFPVSLVVSGDGKTIFVADLGIDDDVDATKAGAIYSLTATGGAFSEIGSTRGYKPRALELVSSSGTDTIYFTGTDPTGAAGLFKLAGGAVSAIATGGFVEPSGLAVDGTGVAYVADVSDSMARVVKITADGTTTELVNNIKVGTPAGVALSQDQKFLVVSGLNADDGTSIIHRVELATGVHTQFNMGIGANHESAGLHRALNVDKYVWVSSGSCDNGDTGGTVYELGTASAPVCH